MSDIRTPDDEITKPGYFYPPFKEGDWYQGATYGGHTDFSVDWNKRTRSGAWLDDRGEPVLAAARGTVRSIDRATGTVILGHWNDTWRTEYRHMGVISVRPGDKVERGDKLGEIGAEGISPDSGFVPSPHLHHVHHRKVRGVWKRVKQAFMGKEVIASVGDSDSRPRSWDPPGPVMVQGPPTRATWESAAKEAIKELDKAQSRNGVLVAERDALKRDIGIANTTILAQGQTIADLEAKLAEQDCTAAVAAEHERMVDLVEQQHREMEARIR